jgi:hypothetical protein
VLLAAVERSGIDPGRVVIEVTERFGGRMASVVKSLRGLRGASRKLALDDVGAGNSGLEMLSSARSASSTGPRPERQSHWFAASARASSTRSRTSTTPAPWSRSSTPQARTLGEPPETYPTAL